MTRLDPGSRFLPTLLYPPRNEVPRPQPCTDEPYCKVLPVFERSQWIRKAVHFKPRCTIPEALLRWLAGTVNPDGDHRGLIVLSHHGGFSSFSDWFLRGNWRRSFLVR